MLESTEPLFSTCRTVPCETYTELERRVSDVVVDGQVVKAAVDVPVQRDYEITPEYVASFVDSIDYKKVADVRNAPGRGQGLGDVTMAQAIGSVDSSKIADYKSAYEKALKEIQALKAEKAEEPAEKTKKLENEVK